MFDNALNMFFTKKDYLLEIAKKKMNYELSCKNHKRKFFHLAKTV